MATMLLASRTSAMRLPNVLSSNGLARQPSGLLRSQHGLPSLLGRGPVPKPKFAVKPGTQANKDNYFVPNYPTGNPKPKVPKKSKRSRSKRPTPTSYTTPVSYGAPAFYGITSASAPHNYSTPGAGSGNVDNGGDGGSGKSGGRGGSGGSGGSGADSGSGGSGKKAIKISLLLTLIYAGLIAAGGIMGYVRARSKASLGMSLACAGALLYGAFQLAGPAPMLGTQVCLGVSVLLAATFASRYSKSKAIFPAGFLAGFSLFMIAAYGHGIQKLSAH